MSGCVMFKSATPSGPLVDLARELGGGMWRCGPAAVDRVAVRGVRDDEKALVRGMGEANALMRGVVGEDTEPAPDRRGVAPWLRIRIRPSM